MILRQFLNQESVGLSYLIGCGGQGVAAVIDPAGELEPYVQAAEAGGMRMLISSTPMSTPTICRRGRRLRRRLALSTCCRRGRK